jgi:hypothetical protein
MEGRKDMDDLMDFELEKASYVVMVVAYLEGEDDPDYLTLCSFEDPEEAITFAAAETPKYVDIFQGNPTWGGKTIKGALLAVDTLVAAEDGLEDFIGQIFREVVYVKPVEN